ncbi:hypothetical protein [Paraburkholderia sp. HD33-4]|nr:hypothetical protein [Paraburkholderia sp. HD33-4]
MKQIIEAIRALNALCLTLQQCDLGGRYLLGLVAIIAIIYVLYWVQK